jgi:hypothetical protein
MKAKVGPSGFARLVVPVPKSAATYKLLVTDEMGRVKASTLLRAHESAVGAVRWLGDSRGLRERAGNTLRQAFPYQVIDKYGNALSGIKMSMDIYNKSRSASLIGVSGESKKGGEGRFSLTSPKKMDRYWAYIYPSDWSDMGCWVTYDVVPAGVDFVQIVTGDNQWVQAGTRAPNDFVLSMKDRYGNPVADQDVNWVYQVKLGTESRFLNTVIKTDQRGMAAFNMVMDKEPGIRELKAFFLLRGKKDKQSFFYKIISNEVGQLQILTGQDQKVNPGRQLPDPIRVRLVNRVGAPIGDAVVRFDIESSNPKLRGRLPELSVHTNPQGVASAFLVSPSIPGKYQIKIFSVTHPQIKSVALLTVL